MKAVAVLFAILAACCIALAYHYPVAEAQLAGPLHLKETTWAGGGRHWVIIGAAILSGIGSLAGARILTGVFAGIALGLAIDICFSGWQWRAETFSMLSAMGTEKPEDMVQWSRGALAFGGAILFLHALSILVIYPRRRREA